MLPKMFAGKFMLQSDIRDFGHQCVWDWSAYAQVSGANAYRHCEGFPPARTFQNAQVAITDVPPALPVPFRPGGAGLYTAPTCCPGSYENSCYGNGL